MNNLQGANKLGPSLKKRQKETEGEEGEQKISFKPFAFNSGSKVILDSLPSP